MNLNGTVDDQRIVDQRIAEQPLTFDDSARHPLSGKAVPIGAIRAMKGMAGMEGMGIMRVNVAQHNNDSKPDNSRSNSFAENDTNGYSVPEKSALEAPDASKPSSEFSAPSRITRRGPGRPRKSPVTVHHTHLHRLAPKQAKPAEYISNHDDVSPPEANRPQMQYRLSRPFDGDKVSDNSEANTHMDRKEPTSDSDLQSPQAKPSPAASPVSRRHSTEVPTTQTAPSVGSQNIGSQNTSTLNSPRRTSHSQTPIEFPQQSPYMQRPGLAFPPAPYSPAPYPPAPYPPMGLNAPQSNVLPQFTPPAPPEAMGMHGYPMFMGGMHMGGTPIGYPSPISAMPMMNSHEQSRTHPNGDPRGVPMGTGLPPPPIVPPSSIPNSLLGNSVRLSPPLERKKSQSQRVPPSNRRRTYGTGGDGFDVFRYSMAPGSQNTPSVAPNTPGSKLITPSTAPVTPSSEPIVPSVAQTTPSAEIENQTPSPKRISSESAKEKHHENSDQSPNEHSDQSPVEQKKIVKNPQVTRGMSVNELMRMANSVAKEFYSESHKEAIDSLKKKHGIETEALVKQQKKQQNKRCDINVDLSRREALRGVQLSEHGSQRQQLKKQQAKELKKLSDKHEDEISSEQRERFVQMRDSLKELEAADQNRRRRRKNGKVTDTDGSDLENNTSGESDEFSGDNDAKDLGVKQNHRPLNKHFMLKAEKNDNKVAFRTSDCQLEWFQGIEEVMFEETIETAKQRLPSESLSFLKDEELPIPKQADLAMTSLFQHQDDDIRQRIAEANSIPRSPKPGLRPPLTGDITNPNIKLIYTVAERGRVQSVVTPAPVTPDVPLRRVSSQKPQRNENSPPRPVVKSAAQVANSRNNAHASTSQMNYPNFPFPHNNGIVQTVNPHHYFQMMQNGSFPQFPYAASVPYGAVPHPLMVPPNAPNGVPAPVSQPMVGNYPPIIPGFGFPMPPNSPGQPPLATPPIPPGVPSGVPPGVPPGVQQASTEQSAQQPVEQSTNQPAEQPAEQPEEQHSNVPFADKARTESESRQTGTVLPDSNQRNTEVDDVKQEVPKSSSEKSPPMFQMSTNGTKRSSSTINDNDSAISRPSKVHLTPDRIPQVVMPLSQSSQDNLSTDAEDSVNEEFEDSSLVKSPAPSIIEKPMKGRKPKGDPNDPNSLENIPRSERYWLDQQNQFMIDLNNLGFEAISKSSTHHECSLCKKIFHSRLLCIRHAAEHLSRKAFWCIECGLEFTRCDTLQRHFKGRCEKRNQRTQKAESMKSSIESSSPKVVSGGMRVVRPSPSLQLSNNSSSNGADGSPGRIPLPMEPLRESLSDSETAKDSPKSSGIRAIRAKTATSDDKTNNNVRKPPHSGESDISAESRIDVEKLSDEQSEVSKHKPIAYSKSSGKAAHEETRPRIPGPVLPPSLASM